jgi:hypothetical protein
MLRSSHTTRDFPCVKVFVKVQLGVSVCNLYPPTQDKAKVVKHSASTVSDSHVSYLRTVIDRNRIRCNIILFTLLYHKQSCLLSYILCGPIAYPVVSM